MSLSTTGKDPRMNMKNSFILELMSLSEDSNKDTLDVLIFSLSSKIDQIKTDMVHELERTYFQFVPSFNKTLAFAEKLEKLNGELDDLHQRIPFEVRTNIETSSLEILDLQTKYSELSQNAKLITNLKIIVDNLEKVPQSLNDKVSEAASLIRSIEDNFDCLEDVDESTCIDIISKLMKRVADEKSRVEKKIRHNWNSCVKINFYDKIDIIVSSDLVLQDSISAMKLLDEYSKYVNNLFTDVLSITEKVLNSKCSTISIGQKGSNQELNISLENSFDSVKDSHGVSIEKSNVLILLFKFVFDNILIYFTTSLEKTSMLLFEDRFGKLVTNEIRNYLVKNISDNNSDLENHRAVVRHFIDIEEYFVDKGLISVPGVISLYENEIESVFSQQQSIKIMTDAREILCIDLLKGQETVGCNSSQSLMHSAVSSECEELLRKSILDDNALQFPCCQISLTTKKLIDLVIHTMDTATSSPPALAEQLYFTSRNCIILFREISPEFHKNNISDLPFAAALFHNDCYYLAHFCLTVGEKYRQQMPFPINQQIITFLDLVLPLRILGENIFLKQLNKQKSILLNLLKENGVHLISNDSIVATKYEVTIRGCLINLTKLRNIWLKVLPVNVFQRSIGTLINTILEELISQLVRVEDVPADEAVKLTTVLEMIIKETPLLLKIDGEPSLDVSKYVFKWGKLKEMVIILGASMKQISERWISGILPAHFTVDEIKHLIRALFQNTDKRAMILSSIK